MYLQWASFYLDQNDPASAQDFLTRAQPLATTPELKGTLFHHRGRLALARGDTGQALEMFTQALTIDRSVLDRAAMAADLFYLGEVYQTRGDLAPAWDNYVRAFDVYAGLGRKAQLAKCLKRLQEVNREGQTGPLPGTLRKARQSHPQPFLIFPDNRQVRRAGKRSASRLWHYSTSRRRTSPSAAHAGPLEGVVSQSRGQ